MPEEELAAFDASVESHEVGEAARS
jgi:hypothetical protein